MNRRQFLAGVVAAPVVAQVGAIERFLVGRYGVPVEVEWMPVDPRYILGVFGLMASVFGSTERAVKCAAEDMSMKMLAPAVAGDGRGTVKQYLWWIGPIMCKEQDGSL